MEDLARTSRPVAGICALIGFMLILIACDPPMTTPTPITSTVIPPTATPTPIPGPVHSTPKFQVFILSPVRTCVAANDFYTGNVCRGTNCGDCNCTWDEFDPPAPLSGISPAHINDPQYTSYTYRECFNVTLTDAEVQAIEEDMLLTRDKAFEWTNGALDIQMEFAVLPHDHVGFVAPDFVFGPFEVDDELLNPYVDADTDFVYVVSGVYDREQNVQLQYACGGSYGEMSIHGAGFASIQYNDICNRIIIDGHKVYEPLIHEYYHNLDWALYNLNNVPDLYQFDSPDWANWDHGSWPACSTGNVNTYTWFPSIDFCEWDPDWTDCNNVQSAGACIHAGEAGGQISWYEHVLRAHYPVTVNFNGNLCRDRRQDYGETGIDGGGPCP